MGFLASSQKREARPTSLDSYVSKSSANNWSKPSSASSGGSWSRQQKRCYQRILTFLHYNEVKGRRMAFVTLTSSPESDVELIMEHFQSLRKRLRRRNIEFEYFNVKTSEGYGVLHLLFAFTSRRGYISQKWLSNTWKQIHKAKIVFIEKYRYKTAKRLSRYFVGQYVSGQSGFERYSWSRKELSGFVKCWHFLKRRYRGRGLYRVWHRFLAGQILYYHAFMVIWCVKPPPDCRVSEFKETPLDTWLYV